MFCLLQTTYTNCYKNWSMNNPLNPMNTIVVRRPTARKINQLKLTISVMLSQQINRFKDANFFRSLLFIVKV